MSPLGLFEAYGVEIETMLVDAASLDVRPVADACLMRAAESDVPVADVVVDDGTVGWSNELVAHLVEQKNPVPVPALGDLLEPFLRSTRRLADAAAASGCRLLGTGMHPWMEPRRETQLWPHEGAEIYAEYDRLYDCRRHGWANLQSVHLNLPFADGDEFARLMAAVRLVVPLIPALAASSPVVDGVVTGRPCNRLAFYRRNSERTPSMVGAVVPEAVFGIDEYRSRILGPIRSELRALGVRRALDEGGGDWLNARGAIARFDRMAVEIRVVDAQENPRHDLAVAGAVAGLVRALVDERDAGLAAQQAVPDALLVDLLDRTVAHGAAARLGHRAVAECFGMRASDPVGRVWRELVPETFVGGAALEPAVDDVLREGALAERIVRALGPEPSGDDLRRVYLQLADCMRDDVAFPVPSGAGAAGGGAR